MSKAGSHVVNVAVGVWSWGRSFLRKRRPEGRHRSEPSFDGRAERALRFLVEAGEVLATSLDYEVTLQRIANLAVPDLADWCAVRILDDEGEFQPVALAFADPARRALAEDLFRLYPPPRDATHGPGEVVRSRRPYFQPEVTDEMQAASARNAEHLRLIRAVGCRSYLCVPMEADGRLLGTLSWIISEPNR
ncbi:MAG TPA: GAF domain-containing protein, partial [Isosphaeraceae bacterium]|nr:GAF domain-containing protein [Isosphaeraceae bacterium]